MTEATRHDAATPLGERSLGLPRPAVRNLEAAGLTTLGAVWEVDDRELLSHHGVGPKAVRLIRALQAVDRPSATRSGP